MTRRRRTRRRRIEDHLLRLEIEDFLWIEADLLDDFRYEEWLDLLTDDVIYWMPIRRNVPSREMEGEFTAEGPRPLLVQRTTKPRSRSA